MTNYQTGYFAEFLARLYMRFCGYRIICRNYVTGRGSTAGEIDFIAVRRRTLIFVEVKKRQTADRAAYAIQPRQQQRIIRGARHFLQQNPQYQSFDTRFDAILITPPFKLRHIPNAWQL